MGKMQNLPIDWNWPMDHFDQGRDILKEKLNNPIKKSIQA